MWLRESCQGRCQRAFAEGRGPPRLRSLEPRREFVEKGIPNREACSQVCREVIFARRDVSCSYLTHALRQSLNFERERQGSATSPKSDFHVLQVRFELLPVALTRQA